MSSFAKFEHEGWERVADKYDSVWSHVGNPERASAEACRVLKPGGKFAFTVWAPAAENPDGKIIDDAMTPYANMEVDLTEGPPHHLYAGREEFRQALERAGFDGASLIFKLHTI